MARGFPAEKLVVQRSGVNIDSEYGGYDEAAGGYVLFAARFVEKKGARR